MNGMFLKKSPKNWQVLQRKNGFATVTLNGFWVISCAERMGAPLTRKAQYRVILEADNSQIIPWTPCRFSTEPDALHGNFNAQFEIPQGGLYRIETSLDTKNEKEDMLFRGDTVLHLSVGDVFIIAGQSNSAGFGKDSAYDPMHEMVHVMRGNGEWDIAAHPLADSTLAPELPSAELSVAGTSPYLSFGKVYYNNTNIPVGLIPAARGGSCISRWDKQEDGELTDNLEYLYNLSGTKCCGILWYQGCSDTTSDKSCKYLETFTRVVKQLRNIIGEETPIFTLQLNHASSDESDEYWGVLREAQRQAAQKITNVYIVPTLDIALCDRIHNSSGGNIALGERLGRFCAFILESKHGYYAPNLVKANTQGDVIILEFENVCGQLAQYCGDDILDAFAAEDEKGSLEFENITINNNAIHISTRRKICPNALISYAFKATRTNTLLIDNVSYLPALAFHKVIAKSLD